MKMHVKGTDILIQYLVLFIQVLCNVNTERTLTEVNKTEGKREGACGRIPFKTFEKGLYADIPCPTEILKA